MAPQLNGPFTAHMGCVWPGDDDALLWPAADVALACHPLSPGYPKVFHNVVHKLCLTKARVTTHVSWCGPAA
jgi:hypothetical protein